MTQILWLVFYMHKVKKIILPITVLVHEGIMARTYLVRLRQAGFMPAAIILMVYNYDPQTGKQIGRLLPAKLRLKYAKISQEMSQNFWPRQLKKDAPDLFRTMTDTICKFYALPQETYDEILGPINYQDFTESFQTLMVNDYKDPELQNPISNLEHKTILFTGGGIIPPSLLSLPDVRFLHIHPGFLPFVRGADGLLWSILTRHKPGVSIFFMDSEIDNGNIISAGETSFLTFPVNKEKRPDDQTLYRFIFSYFDPMLRAQKLIEVFKQVKDPANLQGNPQNMSKGLTYRFMHPTIRNIALKILFPDYS